MISTCNYYEELWANLFLCIRDQYASYIPFLLSE